MSNIKGIYRVKNDQGNYDTIHLETDASQVIDNSDRRFVSDTKIGEWNSKETTGGAQAKATTALNESKEYTDSKIALVEPKFDKNSAFNKNFGTTNGTVAEGNHTHATTDGAYKLLEKDTRNSNESPDWYMRQHGKSVVYEFKNTSTIGLKAVHSEAPAYAEVSTYTSWPDSSGGYPVQFATCNTGLYYRTATNGTMWAAWKKLSSTDLATKDVHGLMDKLDKAKLDTVQTNANNYIHPTSHASSMITESDSKQFVSKADKENWNAKADSGHIHDSIEISDATSDNVMNTIVKRNGSGNFSAGTITASLNGNATSATKLQTARKINGVEFNGTADITIKAEANSHTHSSTDITDATASNTANKIIKRDSSGNFSAGTVTASLSGNATSATKLQTARTINGVSFDGTSNITVKADPNTHNHSHDTISSVNYLKLNKINGSYTSGNVGLLDESKIDVTSAPRTAFMPSEAIKVEYSTDNGATYLDYGLNDSQKMGLFSLNRATAVSLGKSGEQKVGNRVRITVEPTDRYASVDQFYCWFTTSGATCTVTIERSTVGNKFTFTEVLKDIPVDGWSGNNIINFPYTTFGGGSNQTGNVYAYRFTFTIKTIHPDYKNNLPSVTDLRMYGKNVWNCSNNMTLRGQLYNWDTNQNALFPASVQGTVLKSTVATGTSPLTVTSTTMVTNLNAEYVGGRKLSDLALSSHNQASDTINKMTGYVKQTSSAAIATTDTLNVAIGKLEKALDDKSNNHTHPYRSNTWVPAWSEVTSKPNFATVATSGSYNDLLNKPNLATVATTGSYGDLKNRPTIIDINDNSTTSTTSTWSAKKISGSINGKANAQHTHTTSDITGLGSAATYNAGTAANNVPVLDSRGKLSSSILPSIAVNQTFTATSKDDAMSITLEVGDIVILTEAAISKTYLCVNDKSTSFDEKFKALQSGTDSISKGEVEEALKGYVKNSGDNLTGNYQTTGQFIATTLVGVTLTRTQDLEVFGNGGFKGDITVQEGKKIYHEGFRPTAADVGASPTGHKHDSDYLKLSGGVVNGQLSVLGTAASKSFRVRGIQGISAEGNTDSALYLNYDSTEPVYINGSKKVYHEGFKPTASDIGASPSNHNHDSTYLKLSGGNATGNIIFNNNLGIQGKNTSGAAFTLAKVTDGNKAYIGTTGLPLEIASNVNPVTNVNGTIHTLYHTGNKPSAADVGAATTNHNHTTLTGVTRLSFAADSSDSASISTLVESSNTYFDFNLADDAGQNDMWRWRFTPSGGTVFNAMTLDAKSLTSADLVVSGELYSGTNKVYHAGNKPSLGDLGAAPSNHTHDYIKATYVSGGNELPNYFGSDKLKLQMLKISDWGAWGDALWMSSYSGSDVKGSNQLVISKTGDRIGFRRQNYDATTWGAVNEIYHTGNKPTASDVGAAASNHNHDTVYSKISDSWKIEPKKLAANTDLNTLYTSGVYSTDSDGNSGSIKNRPPGTQGFILNVYEIYGSGIAGRQIQVATMRATKVMYMRDKSENADWTGWTKFYTETSKPTASDVGASPVGHTHSEYFAKSGGTITGSTTIQSSAPVMTIKNTGGGDASLIFDRASNANWRMRNSSGDIVLDCDYTTGKVDYYTALRLKYNSGDLGVRGEIYAKDNKKVYHEGNKPTLGDIGAAASNHTHNYAGINGYIAFPTDGQLKHNNSTLTGYLKVTLPQTWTSTMLRFTVDIYNYKTNCSASYVIAGYNYNSNGGTWANNPSAYCISHKDNDKKNLSVQFGHDGTKCAVYIGAAGTAWQYVQVSIRDISVGFGSYELDKWKSGWKTEVTTTLGTITATVNDTFVGTHTHSTLTRGTYLTGSNYNGSANQTWAVDATEAATASKIVARDSNADINCRLLRSNYGNQSTISGAIAFRVNNSTDNYTRYCSDTGAIRTFLNVYQKSDVYTKSEGDGRYRQKTDTVFTDTISITTPAS